MLGEDPKRPSSIESCRRTFRQCASEPRSTEGCRNSSCASSKNICAAGISRSEVLRDPLESLSSPQRGRPALASGSPSAPPAGRERRSAPARWLRRERRSRAASKKPMGLALGTCVSRRRRDVRALWRTGALGGSGDDSEVCRSPPREARPRAAAATRAKAGRARPARVAVPKVTGTVRWPRPLCSFIEERRGGSR